MNGNSFGKIFKVTTWGESHGPALGVVIDGCPSGLLLSSEDFEEDMSRRRGGSSKFATPRAENDLVHIESGVFEGKTTGCPISLRIENKNTKPEDYENFRSLPRPGHADLTTFLKHAHRDHRGGGRLSARETAARTAAGVIAKKILEMQGVKILAWVHRVGPYEIPEDALDGSMLLSLEELKKIRDRSPLFLPIEGEQTKMLENAAEALRSAGDSWGGEVRCRVTGLSPGLGEPIFDKIQALFAHALMSLPAAVAFEAGGGLLMTKLPGSAIRDPIGANLLPESNKHGGILGGMTSGTPLSLSVSFHAPTSIPRPISTVNLEKNTQEEITVLGRHDAFPLPRAVPMVEAMAAITLVDSYLRAGRIPEKL